MRFGSKRAAEIPGRMRFPAGHRRFVGAPRVSSMNSARELGREVEDEVEVKQ